MFALVDCNSFFCSVEKVFCPGLKGKPVCVLSSNDGIIVALTPEAKALGLQRGDPLFKVKDTIERAGVRIFSSNMQLYAAMSRRVKNILHSSLQKVEDYSIDESFCDLRGYEQHYQLSELMRGIAEKIALYTDIPVSVGIAPTKTIAKIASKFAKKYPAYRSVCLIDTDAKRLKALSMVGAEEIWGLGRKTCAKLHSLGVRTAAEFATKPLSWVEAHFTKPTIQTWLELNGKPCIDTSEVLRNQSISMGRSFAQMIQGKEALRESVAHFAASCANKLRAQDSLCKSVGVYLLSNHFRQDLEQYNNFAATALPTASSDTIEITSAALTALDGIFRSGIQYKKAGVVLSEISSSATRDQDLFDNIPNRSERKRLMQAVDALNHRFGLKTVCLTIEGSGREIWSPKSEQRSSDYLTDINGLLEIKT